MKIWIRRQEPRPRPWPWMAVPEPFVFNALALEVLRTGAMHVVMMQWRRHVKPQAVSIAAPADSPLVHIIRAYDHVWALSNRTRACAVDGADLLCVLCRTIANDHTPDGKCLFGATYYRRKYPDV